MRAANESAAPAASTERPIAGVVIRHVQKTRWAVAGGVGGVGAVAVPRGPGGGDLAGPASARGGAPAVREPRAPPLTISARGRRRDRSAPGGSARAGGTGRPRLRGAGGSRSPKSAASPRRR